MPEACHRRDLAGRAAEQRARERLQGVAAVAQRDAPGRLAVQHWPEPIAALSSSSSPKAVL